METLKCQAHSSHFWFIPTDEEETAICSLFVISGQLHLGEIYPNRSRQDYCWHLSPRNSGALLLTDVLCYKSKTRLGSVEQTNESTKLLRVMILSWGSCLAHRGGTEWHDSFSPSWKQQESFNFRLKLYQQPKKYKLRFQGKCDDGIDSDELEKTAYGSCKVTTKTKKEFENAPPRVT